MCGFWLKQQTNCFNLTTWAMMRSKVQQTGLRFPEGADGLRVGFTLKGGGRAEFKRPRVEIVDDSSAAHERAITPDCFMQKAFTLRNKPGNLDFTDSRTTYSLPKNSIMNWSVHTDKGFVAYVHKRETWRNKPSVRFYCTEQTPTGIMSIFQLISAIEYRGTRVQFSASVKSLNVPDWRRARQK
jgi:hypothetical protein